MPRRMSAIACTVLGALALAPLVAAYDRPGEPAPPVYLSLNGGALMSVQVESSQEGSTYSSEIQAALSIVDLPDPISVAIHLTIVDGPDPFGFALLSIVDEPDPLGIIDLPDPISVSAVATIVDGPDPFGIVLALGVGH